MSTSLALTLVAGGLGLASFAWLVLRLRRAVELRRIVRRFQRGAEGEQQAKAFLQRQGFEIVAEQQAQGAGLWVDGERHDFEVRIDYVVRRRGRTFGVEVKTGNQATDPLFSVTRRQLREYCQLFPFHGLYLLDMDEARLMRIRFDDPPGRGRGSWVWLLALGFVLGVSATLFCAALLTGD